MAAAEQHHQWALSLWAGSRSVLASESCGPLSLPAGCLLGCSEWQSRARARQTNKQINWSRARTQRDLSAPLSAPTPIAASLRFPLPPPASSSFSFAFAFSFSADASVAALLPRVTRTKTHSFANQLYKWNRPSERAPNPFLSAAAALLNCRRRFCDVVLCRRIQIYRRPAPKPTRTGRVRQLAGDARQRMGCER